MKFLLVLLVSLVFTGCSVIPKTETLSVKNIPNEELESFEKISKQITAASESKPSIAIPNTPNESALLLLYNKPSVPKSVEIIPTPGVHKAIIGTDSVTSSSLGFFVRDILYRHEEFPNRPFSYILFPREPVSKFEEDKYLLICQVWRSSFELKAKVYNLPSNTVLIPFYWMVNGNKSMNSCDFLIENYDYARAKVIAFRNELEFNRTYLIYQFKDAIITMDIDGLESLSELRMAMDKWQRELRSIPRDSDKLRPYDVYTSAKAVLAAFKVFPRFHEKP